MMERTYYPCTAWNLMMRAVLLLFVLPGVPGAAADGPLLEKYFEALRARGLFIVAEDYATAGLARETLSPEEHLTFSIELARTLVEHGMFQAEDSQQELWEQARQVLDSNKATGLSAQAIMQMDLWKTLLASVQGNSLAFRAELEPEREMLRTQAIDQLHPAIRKLREFDSRLETARGIHGELSPAQRERFRERIHLAAGESLLWLARLEPRPEERVSLLQQANGFLGKADRPRNTFPGASRKALILLAASARLENDPSRAEKLLDRAEGDSDHRAIEDAVLAERLRLELSRGMLDRAVELAVQRFRKPPAPSDELRAEAVQALLQAADLAASQGDSLTRQQTLDEAARQHVQTFGIWRLKTAILMRRYDQNQQLGRELAEVVRTALAAWQAGHPDQAIDKYGAATKLALKTDHPDEAFEYALTRASILVQLRRWPQAQDALAEILSTFPLQSRLGEAHLLQCFVIGQRTPHSAEFVAALHEHVLQFPNASTSGEAYWMLASEAEQQRDIVTAIENYRLISNKSPRKEEADLRIALLLETLFKTREATSEQRAQWNTLAAAEIRRIALPRLTGEGPVSLVQCRILLQCLQLCLLHHPPLIADAEQLLAVVDRRITEERRITTEQQLLFDSAWEELSQSSVQLRIILLASQKKLAEARNVLQQLGRENPGALLTILSSLTDLTSRLDLANLQELGTLQRMTVNELSTQRSGMTDQQRLLLDRAAIQASIALEDWSGAIRTLEDLRKKYPQDKLLVRQFIEISLKRAIPEDLSRAREGWIQLEQLEQKGTPAWIEARLHIARLLARGGDIVGARKLLGVTRALYPQMGNTELKQQADALWEELGENRPQ